jgi:hypothetical protein
VPSLMVFTLVRWLFWPSVCVDVSAISRTQVTVGLWSPISSARSWRMHCSLEIDRCLINSVFSVV